jgi:hypothetical protein
VLLKNGFLRDFVKKMKDNELQQSFTQLENEMVAAARKDLGLTE